MFCPISQTNTESNSNIKEIRKLLDNETSIVFESQRNNTLEGRTEIIVNIFCPIFQTNTESNVDNKEIDTQLDNEVPQRNKALEESTEISANMFCPISQTNIESNSNIKKIRKLFDNEDAFVLEPQRNNTLEESTEISANMICPNSQTNTESNADIKEIDAHLDNDVPQRNNALEKSTEISANMFCPISQTNIESNSNIREICKLLDNEIAVVFEPQRNNTLEESTEISANMICPNSQTNTESNVDIKEIDAHLDNEVPQRNNALQESTEISANMFCPISQTNIESNSTIKEIRKLLDNENAVVFESQRNNALEESTEINANMICPNSQTNIESNVDMKEIEIQLHNELPNHTEKSSNENKELHINDVNVRSTSALKRKTEIISDHTYFEHNLGSKRIHCKLDHDDPKNSEISSNTNAGHRRKDVVGSNENIARRTNAINDKYENMVCSFGHEIPKSEETNNVVRETIQDNVVLTSVASDNQSIVCEGSNEIIQNVDNNGIKRKRCHDDQIVPELDYPYNVNAGSRITCNTTWITALNTLINGHNETIDAVSKSNPGDEFRRITIGNIIKNIIVEFTKVYDEKKDFNFELERFAQNHKFIEINNCSFTDEVLKNTTLHRKHIVNDKVSINEKVKKKTRRQRTLNIKKGRTCGIRNKRNIKGTKQTRKKRISALQARKKHRCQEAILKKLIHIKQKTCKENETKENHEEKGVVDEVPYHKSSIVNSEVKNANSTEISSALKITDERAQTTPIQEISDSKVNNVIIENPIRNTNDINIESTIKKSKSNISNGISRRTLQLKKTTVKTNRTIFSIADPLKRKSAIEYRTDKKIKSENLPFPLDLRTQNSILSKLSELAVIPLQNKNNEVPQKSTNKDLLSIIPLYNYHINTAQSNLGSAKKLNNNVRKAFVEVAQTPQSKCSAKKRKVQILQNIRIRQAAGQNNTIHNANERGRGPIVENSTKIVEMGNYQNSLTEVYNAMEGTPPNQTKQKILNMIFKKPVSISKKTTKRSTFGGENTAEAAKYSVTQKSENSPLILPVDQNHVSNNETEQKHFYYTFGISKKTIKRSATGIESTAEAGKYSVTQKSENSPLIFSVDQNHVTNNETEQKHFDYTTSISKKRFTTGVKNTAEAVKSSIIQNSENSPLIFSVDQNHVTNNETEQKHFDYTTSISKKRFTTGVKNTAEAVKSSIIQNSENSPLIFSVDQNHVTNNETEQKHFDYTTSINQNHVTNNETEQKHFDYTFGISKKTIKRSATGIESTAEAGKYSVTQKSENSPLIFSVDQNHVTNNETEQKHFDYTTSISKKCFTTGVKNTVEAAKSSIIQNSENSPIIILPVDQNHVTNNKTEQKHFDYTTSISKKRFTTGVKNRAEAVKYSITQKSENSPLIFSVDQNHVTNNETVQKHFDYTSISKKCFTTGVQNTVEAAKSSIIQNSENSPIIILPVDQNHVTNNKTEQKHFDYTTSISRKRFRTGVKNTAEAVKYSITQNSENSPLIFSVDQNHVTNNETEQKHFDYTTSISKKRFRTGVKNTAEAVKYSITQKSENSPLIFSVDQNHVTNNETEQKHFDYTTSISKKRFTTGVKNTAEAVKSSIIQNSENSPIIILPVDQNHVTNNETEQKHFDYTFGISKKTIKRSATGIESTAEAGKYSVTQKSENSPLIFSVDQNHVTNNETEQKHFDYTTSISKKCFTTGVKNTVEAAKSSIIQNSENSPIIILPVDQNHVTNNKTEQKHFDYTTSISKKRFTTGVKNTAEAVKSSIIQNSENSPLIFSVDQNHVTDNKTEQKRFDYTSIKKLLYN
ncbi:hypothetical protein FQA39_LY17728 [Lamprigera yunnana]|nr:hypothetical protein FQA39_LY17728 [Lamprigera yunnana]